MVFLKFDPVVIKVVHWFQWASRCTGYVHVHSNDSVVASITDNAIQLFKVASNEYFTHFALVLSGAVLL